MNLWAFFLGLAMLLCMGLMSRKKQVALGGAPAPADASICPEAENSNYKDFYWIEIIVALGIVGVLAAIALPSYQNYKATSPLKGEAASLVTSKAALAEVISQTDNPKSKVLLLRANTDLERATEYIRAVSFRKGEVEDIEVIVKLISSAAAEIEEVNSADPALHQAPELEDISRRLRYVESNLSKITYEPSVDNSGPEFSTSLIVVLSICSAFFVVFFIVYFMVLSKHGGKKPKVIEKQLRALLEPLMSIFAIVLGMVLVLSPGLDQSIAMWGAGVSGSGVGYWLKTTGS